MQSRCLIALSCFLSVITLAIASHNSVAAETGATKNSAYLWRPVAIGGGGFITGYEADLKGQTRIIRTDVYGAYKWIFKEQRWAQLVNSSSMPPEMQVQNGAAEGVFEIAVAPSDPNRIYIVIKGYVFRSDNGGDNFILTSKDKIFPLKIDPNSEFRHYGSYIAVSPDNRDLLFFGTPTTGLLRSSDGGNNWTSVSTVPLSKDLRSAAGLQSPGILPWFERSRDGGYSGRVVVMSAGNGLYVSNDHGERFLPFTPTSQIQPKTLKQIAYNKAGVLFGVDRESRTVWRFSGEHWDQLTSIFGLRPANFASIAINPRNDEIFVFEESGRAHRSTNGGESWVVLPHRAKVAEADPPWLRVADQSYFATSRVKFDPIEPDLLISSAGTAVYTAHMPTGSKSIVWTSKARGIEELVTNDVVSTVGYSPLFAAWDFGIHVKDNLNAFSSTYGPRERVLIAAQQVDWTIAAPGFFVTNASDTRMNCCSEDGQSVLAGFSADGGRSWERFPTLPQPPGTQSSDPWKMSFGMIAVSASDPNNIIWAPTFNRSPFFTKDRGRTWTRVSLPGEVLPFTGSHSNYFMPRRTLAADRVLGGVFYYFHSGDGQNAQLLGLWRTDDGGESWLKVYNGEIAPLHRFSAKLRAVPEKPGNLFFSSSVGGGSDTRLRRSFDGGKTWTIMPRLTRVDDIGFGKAATEANYPTIFISGKVDGLYGIWRSDDNAATWIRIGVFPIGSLDQVSVVEGDKNHFGRVYLGYKGSGWRYGEPSSCVPEPYRFPHAFECLSID